MLYISENDVKVLLTWEKTFQAVEVAMHRSSQGQVVQKPRTYTNIPNTGNVLLSMPGYLKDDEFGALGCKLVTSFPGNSERNVPLPSINASIMIFDEETGIMNAVIGGTEITTQRTAAASAVATKHLYVNNSKPCNTLAILGAGTQGKIHAEMFRYLFNFREVRIWNRTKERAKKLAEELNNKYKTTAYKYYEDNEQCVRGADVIVTTTYSPHPIVFFEWVKKGAHINAVGANKNHFQELEEKLYLNGDIYLDNLVTMKAEMVGLEKLFSNIKGEVGAVINKVAEVGSKDRITIFNGGGMAVEDCAVGRAVYELYKKRQV